MIGGERNRNFQSALGHEFDGISDTLFSSNNELQNPRAIMRALSMLRAHEG